MQFGWILRSQKYHGRKMVKTGTFSQPKNVKNAKSDFDSGISEEKPTNGHFSTKNDTLFQNEMCASSSVLVDLEKWKKFFCKIPVFTPRANILTKKYGFLGVCPKEGPKMAILDPFFPVECAIFKFYKNRVSKFQKKKRAKMCSSWRGKCTRKLKKFSRNFWIIQTFHS